MNKSVCIIYLQVSDFDIYGYIELKEGAGKLGELKKKKKKKN